MDPNDLTTEENKKLADEKLTAYCSDTIISEPPSHADCISGLFDSFTHTGFGKSRETHLEKLQNDFPNIDENELKDLIVYFKQVTDYCDSVCSAYASKYPYPLVGSGNTQEERKDIGRVVKACRQKYPWLKQEYIEMHLKGVVAMCIR